MVRKSEFSQTDVQTKRAKAIVDGAEAGSMEISAQEAGRGGMAPSEGERRALRNLSAQYRIAAKLTRDALFEGELEWVRLLDPKAGRLDDVQIARHGRLDAYQIKWSDYRSQLTFKQLITNSKISDKSYPAPIRLLADGWATLQALHPERVVRAHFLTHDGPSSSLEAKVPGAGDPPHLQGFLRHAWPHRGQWRLAEWGELLKTWQLKIASIEDCTNLSGHSLTQFLAHCELDLGFELDERPGSGRERRERDVAAIGDLLVRRAISGKGAVTITRNELIRELGWSGRFELNFRHDFPVDEHLYRPVEATVSALRQALVDFESGYVALVGPPGSGKSTTLTHTLRYESGIRLVRYYAFVRDDPRTGRGEAESFLHDLCIFLEGLAPGAAKADEFPDGIAGLRDRLAALLSELAESWREQGIKTIILVDGLDHIDREQSPKRSLIQELPHPDNLPAGILVVLGTQRVGLENGSSNLRPIVAQLAQGSRTIEMASLSRASIRSIVEHAVPLCRGQRGQLELIEQISSGHPLQLAYLVNKLSALPDLDAIDEVLAVSESYTGEIEQNYRTYWESLRTEAEVRDLLGLISRLRGSVDLAAIEALTDASIIERFVATARHFFRQDSPSSWRFFHNSFRQFILAITSSNAFGRYDPKQVESFHRRLALAGESSPAHSQLQWERLYHLELAGLPDELLALDHYSLFREQFLAGRQRADIEDDLHRCMRSAANQGNALLVLRMLLCEKELGDRCASLEDVNLSSLAVKLAAPEDRQGALVSGAQLLVSPKIALEWSQILASEGCTALAAYIFDMAEPLDLFSGARRVNASGKDDTLDAWATVAWRFRPVEVVIAAIQQVRVDVREPDVPPPYEDETRADRFARASLVTTLALSLLAAGEVDKLAVVLSLAGSMPGLARLPLRLDIELVRSAIASGVASSESAAALDRVLDRAVPEKLKPFEVAQVANLICLLGINTERADNYLGAIPAPLLHESAGHHDRDVIEAIIPLLRQARALAARGKPFDPGMAVPIPQRDRELGWAQFQRSIIRIANLWGEALRGAILAPAEVVRRLALELRFYRRPWQETHEWRDWHDLWRAAPEFFSLILEAARAHGRPAFDAVYAAIRDDWKRREHKVAGWSIELRRAIALHAFQVNEEPEQLRSILEDLDAEIDISFEVHDRISEWEKSLDAWLKLGDRERARGSRDALLATSFSLYHDRDSQVQDWTELAVAAMGAMAPTERTRTARLFLGILAILHKTHRGGGRNEAVRHLLECLSHLDSPAALRASHWLLDGGGALRSDVFAGLVAGQLRVADADVAADALTIASRLMIPFELRADSGVAKRVTEISSGPLAHKPRVRAALEEYRLAVKTKCQHPSTYSEFLGEARTSTKKNNAPKFRHALVTAKGVELNQKAIEELAADPDALASVLAGAQLGSIDWGVVLDRLPSSITRSTLTNIARTLIASEVNPRSLPGLVRLAKQAGDEVLVNEAVAASIKSSNRYGWMRHYDGGSRQAAAECLTIADPVNGRRRALQLLVEDHQERALPVRDLLGELDHLLPLISTNLLPIEIWAEVRHHVEAVAEATEGNEVVPDLDDLESLKPGEMSVKLLAGDLLQPAQAVVVEARKGLLSRLRAGDPGGLASNELNTMLGGDQHACTAALSVVACLAWSHPDLAQPILDRIKSFAIHPDGVLRRLAQQILTDVDEALPSIPTRKLPPIYSLALPSAPMKSRSLRGDELPPGEPLPDTEDAVDLARLFHEPIEEIERQTGRSFSLLTNRFAQIMRSGSKPESWSARAERELMANLEAIGLKVAMRRPRSMAALHAFGILVGELCDAGELDWVHAPIDSWLCVADPFMDTRDPQPKPDWLELPSGKDVGSYPLEDWLAGVSLALPELRTTPDGAVVLAEFTTIKSMEGSGAEEGRLSVVSHPRLVLRREMPSLYRLGKDRDYIGCKYPYISGSEPRPSTVIAGGPVFCEADFLALNPVLAAHMGWQYSPSGLFRWEDEAGRLMVESLWWQQGNLSLNERSGMDEIASTGWLVLATPEGWKQMRTQIDGFVIHRLAGRNVGERSGDHSPSTVSGTSPLPA